MKLSEVHRISVVGAGIMGHGIAQTMATGGYDVCLHDISAELLWRALERVRANLRIFADNGFITSQDAERALSRISPEPDFQKAVQDADIVIEAVKEDIEVKREVFNRLGAVCKPTAVLASNSSSLLISDFASGTSRQDRVVLVHWVNPPHIVPTVEIIRGKFTSDETVDLVYDLLKKVKKLPVRINKELPGYVVNRIQFAMLREVWYLWREGVASAEDLDLAIKGSLGFRLASIGPLVTSDLGGQDTFCAVARYLFPLLDASQAPPDSYVSMVESGQLGLKTGKGIFEHSKEEWEAIVEKRDSEFLQRLKALYW
jgi:3-hydroxybutyryl-CoA dehydrogenase